MEGLVIMNRDMIQNYENLVKYVKGGPVFLFGGRSEATTMSLHCHELIDDLQSHIDAVSKIAEQQGWFQDGMPIHKLPSAD